MQNLPVRTTSDNHGQTGSQNKENINMKKTRGNGNGQSHGKKVITIR